MGSRAFRPQGTTRGLRFMIYVRFCKDCEEYFKTKNVSGKTCEPCMLENKARALAQAKETRKRQKMEIFAEKLRLRRAGR